jgi:hypothetical protein
MLKPAPHPSLPLIAMTSYDPNLNTNLGRHMYKRCSTAGSAELPPLPASQFFQKSLITYISIAIPVEDPIFLRKNKSSALFQHDTSRIKARSLQAADAAAKSSCGEQRSARTSCQC